MNEKEIIGYYDNYYEVNTLVRVKEEGERGVRLLD